MKKNLLIIAILFNISLFALSPQFQFDMLKEKLAIQLKAQQYSKALATMERIKNLGIKTPKSFSYFEGKVLFESGSKAQSYSKFESYVETNGKEAQFYDSAISYLVKAEDEKLAQEREAIVSSFSTKDKYGNIYKAVISPYTARIWLDRNLGASRICTSYNDNKCYGDYFQWGRLSDGHEKANSKTVAKLASSSSPKHSNFIVSNKDKRYDWIKSKHDSLWQVSSNLNNPCPTDFRIPTINELLAETIKQGVKNKISIANDFLKLPSSGYRQNDSGTIAKQGIEGNVWSSTTDGKGSQGLGFDSDYAYKYYYDRAYGFSVRCIKSY
jgi:hypothetical protein